MNSVNLEKVRQAGATIMALSLNSFEQRKREEIGDPLIAFFLVLALKSFPESSEEATRNRVDLMVASYLLRSEIDGTSGTPPDEETAKKKVQVLTSLDRKAFDDRVDAEIGNILLAFFEGLSNKVMPECDSETKASNVYLMVLAYLLHADLRS